MSPAHHIGEVFIEKHQPSIKLPFKDARGMWWIYRSDDSRKTPSPLGPFSTWKYAIECALRAQDRKAPMPVVLNRRPPDMQRGAIHDPLLVSAMQSYYHKVWQRYQQTWSHPDYVTDDRIIEAAFNEC